MKGNFSDPKPPSPLIEKKNPGYLVDMMKQHVDIVWEEDFKKNPFLYKNKIVAVIVWYSMPKVGLT